ncbi:MAG: 30S ribosomal subunit protein S11 [Candidatus Woesebacteria bacterium GW2011_GWA1_39_8]|uniref:Small ribosomal subunit protein uS11 n=1 Tax=Candidatus Woesebacteria bacterium GW2011_GWA1_39_8 TaxID=1618552 RepID=A0A0G0SQP7_9BACT|nr:MAG: 30S ribosomal subunit protein S11 [Candidatus Woesebacteria bacterium GW2011_GWA1_39_8]
MGKKKITEQSQESTFKEKETMDAAVVRSATLKKNKKVQAGRIYIKASYNNTIVTVTDTKGGVLAWVTAGSLGFSGPKKATPFASSKTVAAIAEKLKNTGPIDVEVIVKGVGGGRDSAIRSLINHGFNITTLRDITPIPHNGPRPKKPRRI